MAAVDAESTGRLPKHWLEHLAAAAGVLAERIASIGVPVESLTQRTARVVVELTGMSELVDIERSAVTAATELSGMSTSVLARRLTRDLVVTAGTGPLNAPWPASAAPTWR